MPEAYNRFSGTSLSAPFVTGAIAILLNVYPDLTPDEVVSILVDSADRTSAQSPAPVPHMNKGSE